MATLHSFPPHLMRTRHGITQVRGFKRILRAANFESFLDEHPEARLRWDVLRPIFDETISAEAAANVFKISERTIRRWRNEWSPDSWYSLLPMSTRPKTTPRKLTSLERKLRVVEIANDHLAWGAPKIYWYIRQEDSIALHIGKRTASRILAKGLLSGEIVPRVKLKALVHHRKDVRGRTINRVKNSTDPASAPGERVHNDGVIVQIFLAKQGILRRLYFSNTIDRFSKLAMVVAGEHLTPELTIASHMALERILGEPIREKINDNGSENLGACIEFYEGKNIIQLFTYPHAPKQNSVAERFNRTFQEECLLGKRIDLTQPIEVIQEQINAWLIEYNTERPHEGIDNMTPIRKLVAWKFQQLPKDRQAVPLCGQMLWRGTKFPVQDKHPLYSFPCRAWNLRHSSLFNAGSPVASSLSSAISSAIVTSAKDGVWGLGPSSASSCSCRSSSLFSSGSQAPRSSFSTVRM